MADSAPDAKEQALLRLIRARDARDAKVKAATEAADAEFWSLVTEELDRRPQVVLQREAAAVLGCHRETIRKNTNRVRERHHQARSVTHPGTAADEPPTGGDIPE